MELLEYRESVFEDIKLNAEVNTSDITSEFISYYSEVLVDAEEISDYTESYFEAIGKRKKKIQLDGFQFDDADNSCVLIITEFTNNPELGSLTNTDIDRLYSRVEAFIEHSLDGFIKKHSEESSIGYGLALELNEKISKLSKFRIFIYTDKMLSKRVKSLKKDHLGNVPVEISIWDIGRMYDLELSSFRKETIEIEFEKYGLKGLPCVKGVESVEENYRAFLMTIPGNILAELYLEHGSRLLEGNVRSFLSIRGKVNKKIRETIIKKPEMFFAYNNGIAATATEIEYEETDYGMYIKKINNLQIINGGQTTASIANAALNKEGNLSKVFVPMKLSVVEKEIADMIIPEISKSANSQNKVSDADFMSNHGFHIRMEEFSRKVLAPAIDGNQYQTVWFYERARGQYVQAQMKLTKSEKKAFALKNPKRQMIKKVDLAKYMNTMNIKPHIVSKGAQASARYFDQEMRKKWETSDTDFNQFYFKRMVSLGIIYNECGKIISNQDWYKVIKSYRANIVTYSIAVILDAISKNGQVLDYITVWNNQQITDVLERQLIIITKEVYDFITREDRLKLNVTEWCKQEECWKRASKHPWTILKDIWTITVDKETFSEVKKEEKKTQQLSNEIDAEMEVITKGSAYWKKMMDWAVKRKAISQIEKQILNVAATFEYNGKIPSAKQAKRILKIREKISLEGYDC